MSASILDAILERKRREVVRRARRAQLFSALAARSAVSMAIRSPGPGAVHGAVSDAMRDADVGSDVAKQHGGSSRAATHDDAREAHDAGSDAAPDTDAAHDAGSDAGRADSERAERTLASLARPAGGALRVIAEVKRASPSAGVIRPRSRGDVEAIARSYAAAGAAAISVLADGPGFGGSVLDVRRAARSVSIPILFKEFVLDSVQLDCARAAGASLVLLLVRALPSRELLRLVREAEARGLVPLVEAADADELDRALGAGARLVGVNARDLATFSLDLAAADAVLERVPAGFVAVLLSGVRTPADVARVSRGRADAVLVGTELMRASDPGARLSTLLDARASC